ncbi:MAG: Co2+/Mg2+ efflux protein ApaG [Burkholderiaceae bacterium]
MGEKENQPKYQIRIAIEAKFVPEHSNPDNREYAFAYTVNIINDGSVPAQLISRRWIIEDESGEMIEVQGLGVVGYQPLLQPGEQFEYTSGSQLRTPTGSMHGSYFFVAEDGHRFDADIPAFVLSTPRTLH